MSGRRFIRAVAVVAIAVTAGIGLAAQRQGGAAGGAAPATPPPPPRAAAPIDLTGYWVSVITEDWRWRMVTPAKGDYASVPINAAAKKVADSWDPARDEKAGDACKGYAAPGVMRLPTRLHVSWQDDNTLKVETDAGQQTRVLHFGDWKPVTGSKPTWQGDTTAQWETPPARRAGGAPTFGPRPTPDGRGAGPTEPERPRWGNLKTVTTRLRAGYLRKNGVPYSEKATLTEYWDLLKQKNGDQWLVITTIVDDPTYLTTQWITSLNFKKEMDGSKWDPSACSAK